MAVSIDIRELLEKYAKVFIYTALLYFLVSLIIFAAQYVKITIPQVPLWVLSLAIGILVYVAFKQYLSDVIPARSPKEAISTIIIMGIAFGLFGVLTSVYASFGMSMSVFGPIEALDITATVGKIIPTFVNNFIMGALIGVGMALASFFI